jgi:hypothetical protein
MTRMTPDKAQQHIADLDARLAEGREFLADFKETVKEAKTVLSDAKKLLQKDADERVENAVAEALAKLSDATAKAINDATDAVYERFDTIQAVLLGEDRKGKKRGESIPDMILRMPIRTCCQGRHVSNTCPYGGVPGSREGDL